MKPRLTIVIPIRNRQELGERALRSAAVQLASGVEVIIVDDASEPPFRVPDDIGSKLPITLLRLSENRGASFARNTGISSAHADWIAFLDSDDYWLSGTLAPRLEEAEGDYAINRNPLAVHAAGFVLAGSLTKPTQICIPRESADPLDFASACWFAPGSTLLVRREAFDRVGPYDVALRRLEDLDWFLRLALRGGSLKVWEKPAAVIEIEAQFPGAHLTLAVAHLHSKYLAKHSPDRLSNKPARRLRAYLNVERAAFSARQKKWLEVAFYIAWSLCQVPRTTLHLADFWRFEPPPAEIVPAREADTKA